MFVGLLDTLLSGRNSRSTGIHSVIRRCLRLTNRVGLFPEIMRAIFYFTSVCGTEEIEYGQSSLHSHRNRCIGSM